MTSQVIRNGDDWLRFATFVGNMPFPYTVSVTKGPSRSAAQNALIHKWFGEIALDRGDMTADEIKAACNLAYGKKILMRDDPEWADCFGCVFDVLNHETKLDAIRIMDIPFTRRMKVKQLSEYMDNMMRDCLKRGILLTDPDGLSQQ